MNPALLSLIGSIEEREGSRRCPTLRAAYCTGTFRRARSTRTITATSATQSKAVNCKSLPETAPCLDSSRAATTSPGSETTMPTNRMSASPLPSPWRVICSLSQTRKNTPPTIEAVVDSRNQPPGSATRPGMFCMADAMPKAWNAASSSVSINVKRAILRRPASPDRSSELSRPHTTDTSWMTIAALR